MAKKTLYRGKGYVIAALCLFFMYSIYITAYQFVKSCRRWNIHRRL